LIDDWLLATGIKYGFVLAQGIGKNMVNKYTIAGIEITEKIKLPTIN
jgi:hypothetical protein